MTNDEHSTEAHFIEESDSEGPFEEGVLLSLNQVAEALSISNPTARRLCMSGKLQAVKLLVNEQLCWKVKPESLKAYQEDLLTDVPSEATKMKPRQKTLSGDERPFTNPPSGDFPIEAHLAALDTARRALERLERLEDQLEKQRERVDQQRARADQAERQKIALEHELRQYQLALTEQAESLAEMRAEKQTVEMRLEQQLAMPAPELPLKVATHKPTFGQRVKSWFGFKAAQ